MDTLIRPYELDEETVVDDSYYVIIDDAGFPEPKKMTVGNLVANEATARGDVDDEIIDGCGLETDGTFLPDDTTHYVRSTDFVTAGLTAHIKNAVRLLDAKIFSLENRLFLEVFYDLSNTNIKNLNTVPLTMYAALAGYVLNPMYVIAKHTFNTAAFGTSGNNMRFKIDTELVMEIPHELWEETSTSIYKSWGKGDIKLKSNTALILDCADVYTLGGGTGRLRIVFELQDENLSSSGATTSCCNIPQTGTFDNGDLVANKLVISHGLNTQHIMGVAVTNDSDAVTVYPFTLGDAGGADKNNKITIDFTAVAPIAATWSYYFVAFIES